MSDDATPYEAGRRDGVLAARHPSAEWLSTGVDGGRVRADAAYNVTVPDDWGHTDLTAYVHERLERAGFEPGPALLTGVDVADARGARCGPVTAYATAGVSNPAALPMEPAGGSLPRDSNSNSRDDHPGPGTVNLIVGTTRSLDPGALANLLAVVVEAKAATLLETVGVPGTTTDAVVVGHDPAGRPARFSGSTTAVGAAARACVREAVLASLRAHYDGRDGSAADAVATARDGVSTDVRATVFDPDAPE